MMKASAFLATFAVAVATPALAAPADPHAGHHPADAVAAPATPAPATPAADAASMPHNCPMMADMGKSMPLGQPSAMPGHPDHMMKGDKPMSPGMMDKCMKPDSAPATPAPDAHKHE